MRSLYFISFSLLVVSFAQFVSSNDTLNANNAVANDKTKFMDLNSDVLLSIIELNPRLSQLTRYIFGKKYSSVKLLNYYYDKKSNSSYYWDGRGDGVNTSTVISFEDNGTLTIQHYETIFKTLKYFGEFITNLEVSFIESFKFYQLDVSKVTAAINSYCTSTLKELHIHNVFGKYFNNMTKPFEKLEHLPQSGEFKNYYAEDVSLTMDQLFPALRNFTLTSTTITNVSCYDRAFPNMEQLYLYIGTWPHESVNTIQIKVDSLLKKNPQIRNLEFAKYTRSILNLTSVVLPNLKTLTLQGKYYNDHSFNKFNITFKTLKRLTIFNHHPRSLNFDELEELTITRYPDIYTNKEWINIVERTPTLLNFVLTKGNSDHGISELELIRLAANQHNWIYADLEIGSGKPEAIIRLINYCDNLKKIRLTFSKFDGFLREKLETIRRVFGSRWIVTELSPTIILERYSK